MKNRFLFFIKHLFVPVWILLMVISCPVSAQERDSMQTIQPPAIYDLKDSLSLVLSRDSLNMETDSQKDMYMLTVLLSLLTIREMYAMVHY
jgi:hypothetical protein